ncbi:FG-GAP-like repeat-containing protein [Longitalea luteola]|uniref:FG-GAP-like repeat-containing protein n=1 Tax=Longitalea luteola TaxID=2812563 RepID=UPI001F6167F8|nr:FG-GAP-like repeat-containing protein [Longitalea luteola]
MKKGNSIRQQACNPRMPWKNAAYITTTWFLALALCLAACTKQFRDATKEDADGQPTARTASTESYISDMNPIKVMSFNVRNDAAGDPFSQDVRKDYCLQIILENNVDIVGLQEIAVTEIEEWFNTQLAAAGYGYYKSGTSNGSPKTIYYKNARFTRTAAGWFTMITSDIRTGKWVVLQDKLNTANSYFVVNSHWTTAGSADRQLNADTVLLSIRQNNTANLPVICLGDFNARPGTAEMSIIKDASGYNMVDALFEADGAPTFHGWDAVGDSKIDYILSTRNLAFTTSSVITKSFTVNGQTLWPSDHYPIMASFVPYIFGSGHNDVNGISASAATKYYFADVDGDGDADKIYWNYTFDSGKPRVFLSNGNGTFAATAVTHAAGASTSSTTRYHYADINGDGKADQIRWNPSLNAGHTLVYLATSGGNFSTTAIDNPEGTSAGTTTIYNFADVNGDGRADKIYWNATFDNGRTRVYLATSGGSFSGTVVNGSEGASTTAGTQFWYADVNGDGKADKILWHPDLNAGKTMVYLSDGDGTFTENASFSNAATSGLSNTRFYFADMNGDGRADKVYWNPDNYVGYLKVYYSDAGAFSGPIHTLRGTSQSENTCFYFADINGDGKADQIRWNYGEHSGQLRNYFAR